MRMNIFLIQASQFSRSFCLTICHEFDKKYMVADTLSRLASADFNLSTLDPSYSKLNILFTYFTTLIEINLSLLKQSTKEYKIDN